eukprot:2830480-Karenia_brevis.AAC.1
MDFYTLHEAHQNPDNEETAMGIFGEHAEQNKEFYSRGLASHILIDIYLCPNRNCLVMRRREQF